MVRLPLRQQLWQEVSYAEGDVINNVIIRDYIDSRFDIIADNNEIVTADKAAD